MRCGDDDLPDCDADERDYAAAWRTKPKRVVPRSPESAGLSATLSTDDIEATVRRLKTEVAGHDLTHSCGRAGPRRWISNLPAPVVLPHGKSFFAGRRPRLRLVASDQAAEGVVRLAYVPA